MYPIFLLGTVLKPALHKTQETQTPIPNARIQADSMKPAAERSGYTNVFTTMGSLGAVRVVECRICNVGNVWVSAEAVAQAILWSSDQIFRGKRMEQG